MAPTVADAERRADQLLEASWWVTPGCDVPLPVDPMVLAQRLGISVRMAILPPDQSGNIQFRGDGSSVITLNTNDHPNRRRFTCAHEIGHYLRRDQDGHVSGYVDYRDTLAGLGVDAEEIYANQFAAALLMPAHLVKRWHDERRTSDHMAQLLGTSVQAMNLRLRNLRLG